MIRRADGIIARGALLTSSGAPRRFRAGCAAIALALTVAYANHFQNSFHFDDSHTVQGNLFIRDLRNLPRFFTWLDQVGRSEEAIGQLREALALSPGESAANDLLLRILERLGRWPELERAAQATLAARSNDATALSMLRRARQRTNGGEPTFDELLGEGVRLYRERNYEQMLRVSNAAIARRPDSALAWNNRCSALNALRRYREGAEACGKALQLKPDVGVARNNLAVSQAGMQ